MAKKIKYIPNIVRGGTAIPINNNTFLLKGRKHEQGGIDIGKDVEAEDGELLQINKNNIKILSNAPIMKGNSPAKYTLRGTYDGTFKDRFNKSFNYQERYKDRNHLNDDGTKQKGYNNKAKIGKRKSINQNKYSFNDWKEKINKYKQLNIDNDNTYDYLGFYNENPENAYAMLNNNPDTHFTDKYKLPTHPTFSNESIYSNNKTKGGKWIENNGKWVFEHSDYTFNHSDETNEYLRENDNNVEAIYKGGIVLDSSKVTADKHKKFNIGGTTNTTLNYIGSDLKNESDKSIDTRLKAIEISDIAPLIYDIAKKENINPNLLLNRFVREGHLDNQIKEYNEGFKPAILNIKDFPIIDTHLGLDYLAKLYEDKKVNLDGLKFYRNGNKRKGEPKDGGITFGNLESGLTGLARVLKLYENDNVVKAHPENKEIFTNLVYNVGPKEAKKFTDKTAIRRYIIPDYFKYKNLDSRYTKEIEEKEQKELEAQDEQFQKEMQGILNKRIERIKLKSIPLSDVNPVKFNFARFNSKK